MNDAQTIKGQKSVEGSIGDLAKSDLITNRSIENIYDDAKMETQGFKNMDLHTNELLKQADSTAKLKAQLSRQSITIKTKSNKRLQKTDHTQISPQTLYRLNPSRYMKEIVAQMRMPKIRQSFTLVSEQVPLHPEHPDQARKKFFADNKE
jgi:hypothetical protein